MGLGCKSPPLEFGQQHNNHPFSSHCNRPLHIAARNGLASVVQALLSRGATVLAVDEEGMHHSHLEAQGKSSFSMGGGTTKFDAVKIPVKAGN